MEQMKAINSQSWHWKLAVDRYPFGWKSQVSLCKYFWMVVWCVLAEGFKKATNFLFKGSFRICTIIFGILIGYVLPVFTAIAVAFNETLLNAFPVLWLGPVLVFFGTVEIIVTVLAAIIFVLYKVNKSGAFKPIDDFVTTAGNGLDRLGNVAFSETYKINTTALLVFLFYVTPVYIFLTLEGDSASYPNVWWIILLKTAAIIGAIEIVLTVAALLIGAGYSAYKIADRLGTIDWATKKFEVARKAATAVSKVKDSETYQLVANYVQAKKRKVCPLLAVPNLG